MCVCMHVCLSVCAEPEQLFFQWDQNAFRRGIQCLVRRCLSSLSPPVLALSAFLLQKLIVEEWIQIFLVGKWKMSSSATAYSLIWIF